MREEEECNDYSYVTASARHICSTARREDRVTALKRCKNHASRPSLFGTPYSVRSDFVVNEAAVPKGGNITHGVPSVSLRLSSQTFISVYLLPTTDINFIACYCNFFTPTGSM